MSSFIICIFEGRKKKKNLDYEFTMMACGPNPRLYIYIRVYISDKIITLLLFPFLITSLIEFVLFFNVATAATQTMMMMINTIEVAVPIHVNIKPRVTTNSFKSISSIKPRKRTTKTEALEAKTTVVSLSFNQTVDGQLLGKADFGEKNKEKSKSKKRIFFLDVNPLCYEGSRPSLQSFGRWMSLFFNQVSHTDPVIAVS